MEWLLILSLGIVGVESPPPVVYADRKECVAAAKRIAAEYNWLHFFDIGSEVAQAEPGVFRPTVYCLPANWAKKPRRAK